MTSHELRQESPLVVVVQRWKRYGHDRVYVKVDGVQIGYRDMVSSVVHCALPEHRSLIEHATASFTDGPVPGAPPAPAEAAPATGPTPTPQMPVSPASERPMPASPTPTHSMPMSPASERLMPASPSPTPRAATTARALLPDQDLAHVRAGAAARSQAVALRQAAPVRTMLSRMLGVKTDERAWRIGADAEQEVARRLAGLGPGWHVLHAVPVGDRGSDIDHVVIGPGGVFTVNTKNHPTANVWVRGDTFKVNGQNTRYIYNSRFEARRAADLLSAAADWPVQVRGIIAVMGAQNGFTVKEQPKDGTVTVVTRKALRSHLTSLPAVLDAWAVEQIYEHARHLATWQPKTVQWLPFDV